MALALLLSLRESRDQPARYNFRLSHLGMCSDWLYARNLPNLGPIAGQAARYRLESD